MCEQCCVKSLNWDTGLGLALILARQDGNIMKAGQWGLVVCNDPEVVWTSKPLRDPLFGLSDAEVETMPEDCDDAFSEALVDFRDACYFRAEVGHALMERALSLGFDPRENFEHWLLHHLGNVVETIELFDDGR